MQFFTRSHIGKVRRENQDFLATDNSKGFAIVADGIGGENFGGVASKMAVDSCLAYLNDIDLKDLVHDYEHHLVNAIKYANDEIITVQRNEPKYARMGSTLTCFGFNNGYLHYAWVGDSRIYKINPERDSLVMLSKDHTLDKSKIDPQLAPNLYKRANSILTQNVGSILLLKPDQGSCIVERGDIILSCTDGLSDRVEDGLILEFAKNHFELDGLADKLLERALDCGGQDNISFILNRVDY